ncbi:glutamyl-tRNA synthetase [Campylobacter hyointestinalis]|uniref:Glutamate--tRNA ligase n=1 Tax=Campylobacter hyointestinalis subsp. hyointestinalis TaxID=91352 RepID=A0A0S4RCD9_CAMHY|nr:glutamate--tRNA ligase [Campylobacter hyointestinalis]ANE33214.1 glutamyl-tRNA synthetase [Campylobacter hyointestinalis subsp. hyointestinalis LMG 9260]KEA44720.1 glutamyl-tRNA synthetase [Campylobacter hyointestinalis subsp. hyointestinalis]PPB58212.1 glutamate--tRNA ligase [Campylobacter hyointestinalis subsp. hyointestinalis]PPB68421.1 glutamate--tRNA ligase [Campylobacter hyointestinalis subsp. hyointestinalis]QCU00578.1 glutamate--tRNA ligase [Campylobacter hyointestinalis subsp. hyoi
MLTTRFAPSPTGFLHVGGLRTALYSYLYARKNGGKFLLRIEDTDLKRNSEEAVIAIREAFNWCGLDYDGEVTYQSKRFDIYKEYIKKLLDEGKAYKCYMTKVELDELRAAQEAKKERPKYDGRYREFTGTPPAGIEPVIRIKAPLSGTIEFKDGIKGDVKFNCADILDDFIIARSDGTPTYNFVVVIDDALMGVTHVIRGDDHLSNTPKQIILYEALGFDLPEFFHVAMINGSDGSKLSKRHGATDVMEYKAMGYLPEALLNFLVRLGWSHGDDEIFSMSDMLKYFDPHDINKSASTYNLTKLDWLNAHYIKTLPYERLADDMKFFGIDFRALDKGELLLNSLRERSKTLVELKNSALNIINSPETYDEKAVAKFINDDSKVLLSEFCIALSDDMNNAEDIQSFALSFLEARGKKLKDIAQPLRIAITGTSVSPSIFEVVEVIGIKELKARIQKLLKNLK